MPDTPQSFPPLENPMHLDDVLPTDGTSLRANDAPPFLIWLARRLLRLFGWTLYGQFPNTPKCVIATAWHTSNWDGVMMLTTAYALGLRPQWVVKAEWTRGLVGPITRAFSGIGVDRANSRDLVPQLVARINERETVALVIAPEGTRRKTDHWKTGFYWVAHGANVPIVLSFIDFKHKRVGIGGTVMPTGDIAADMERIWSVYRQVEPKDLSRMSEMRLRPHQTKDS
ncbi:MAG: 1-acyl-sn-glycerol-3-phosphate acyltransferase [Armatimonadetes bacterium]|nr:1-acyl-sn-glycerol-3-phosphate acyltransferase [Anaerolineae bacterium]